MLKARTRLWTAILVLAALAFAQAGVALAGCSMDRGMLAGAMSMPAGEGCGACDVPKQQSAMAMSNLCVAHCTADLQQASEAMAIVRGPVLVGVIAAIIAIVLSLFGMLTNPNATPLTIRSFLLVIVIAGGSWGLIAWAIATAAVEAGKD